MIRIAIAGFQHETNTFGVKRAKFEDFVCADSWPEMLRGNAVIAGTQGINLPIAGFAAAAHARDDVSLVPLLWCAAEPSAQVTTDAFERISGEIIDRLEAAGPVDALYLDLHGAMVTEQSDDGEGELLSRLRARIGGDLPIAVSLDLHANLTPRMVQAADVITIYRTYPHLDMADTGARALPLLLERTGGVPMARALRQVPYLIPLPAQFTGASPCRELYTAVAEASRVPGQHAELALGFTAADVPDMGPAILAYGRDQAQADAVADALLHQTMAAEASFDTALLPPDDAVCTAMAYHGDGPVVIADVQDNPGAGASSDSTGMLHALVAAGARGALVGLLCDRDVAAEAFEAGKGAVIETALGGKSGLPEQSPFHRRFRVVALSDRPARFTGAMYGGGKAELGRSAVLEVMDDRADVRAIVTSERSQALDRGLFLHFGQNPAAARIVCVKSTIHFRADFDPVAGLTLLAAAPGGFPCRLEDIPYRRLRPGVRLGPGGPEHPLTAR